ncbi:ATP-binding protein [[Actinomadura] parvosata]|uniref:ATP-binding protein n=1 Tax=[Actinomadura] parvosata TaxID=1955412 RepID=UPI00406C97AC
MWCWTREHAVREEHRIRHAPRVSKMPHHKTLDDDFAYQSELDARKVRDLATLAFVEARANAALLGPPGVGETHIAVAASQAGFSVYFTNQQELIDKGWGERHPLYSPTINVVMLYGPRSAEELDVARSVIAASYRYATGRAP